jgi:hypothetical protein
MYPPASLNYDGEGYACQDGPPQVSTRLGAEVGQCPGPCLWPQTCNSWATSACDNNLISAQRLCDQSSDCTPGGICCDANLIFPYCRVTCAPSKRLCMSELDCTDEEPFCTNGYCRAPPSVGDAGTP